MPWEVFESAARRYEGWYTTPRGQHVDHAEQLLLDKLLLHFPTARRVLEIGCGTGHFSEYLAKKGLSVIGLDRSPAMLAEFHGRNATFPIMLGDAHDAPVRTAAVDVVVFVTTVEFLHDPAKAMTEAVRMAQQGIIVVVLNRWSFGGFSRRWGTQSRQSLLSQAHGHSLWSLQTLVTNAAGARLHKLWWMSTLFPNVFWKIQAPIPFGDVIGMAAALTAPI
jgi:ubiquinone/menaquinone biosynthesis C-methylase UbiE